MAMASAPSVEGLMGTYQSAMAALVLNAGSMTM